jgi:hypothetical protein
VYLAASLPSQSTPDEHPLPDLSRLDGVVAPVVLGAMRVASQALTKVGVRHVIVGGLAVGAYGYARATKGVDFLVGGEVFERHAGGVVTMKPGVPIQVSGVAIDFLSIGADEQHLEGAVANSGGVASAEALVYLKLQSPRARDRFDVIELLKAGLDATAVRRYLEANAPGLVAKFDAVVAAAATKE